ncbi:MAG: hypothetical protein ICV63_18355 [Coleofasciculus sp. Co-bin14]|nr:hypothetical protein [Coleofasciculus sp. Co-bin14]
MQGNKVQFLNCECGLLYMITDRGSVHAIHCPACGRTPRTEHPNQSVPPNVKQRSSSVWGGYVFSGVLSIITIVGLVVVLPRILSQQVQPPTVSAPSMPAPEPSPSRSPISLPNGTELILPQDLQGRGNLTVNNGTPRDAVVKLVDSASGETIRFVYVQANHDATMKNIPPCNCIFKFSTGTDWDRQTRKFLQNPSFSQFTEPLIFEEIQTEGGVKWRDYKVTLHPVVTGKAKTTQISESDFENK